MLGQIDLTNINQVESLRRSVAMAAPGSAPMVREEVLQVLDRLIAVLAATDPGGRFPPPPGSSR